MDKEMICRTLTTDPVATALGTDLMAVRYDRASRTLNLPPSSL